MDAPKVVVEGLCKVFGNNPKQALDMLAAGATKDEVLKRTGQVVGVHNVSFDVQEGEIFVLMGLSGSGKSTLIRLVNRLVDPSAGKVLIDGLDVASARRSALTALRRKDMSMVFQSFALMPQRTVVSNAAFGLEVAGVGKKERERRAMEVLEQVGLAPFSHKLPSELSGGMQQRVGLARALAVNPSLMIMDEAFSALDPLKRREMQDVLLQLQKEQRRTIMFVSHDLEEALRIGSRIAIMEGGRLVQVGTPQDIIANPADDYVRVLRRHRHQPLSHRRRPDADGRRADHVEVRCGERRGDAERQRRIRVRARRRTQDPRLRHARCARSGHAVRAADRKHPARRDARSCRRARGRQPECTARRRRRRLLLRLGRPRTHPESHHAFARFPCLK